MNYYPDLNVPPGAHPNPPSSTYYPNSRARANTINNLDAIPPALARLQHMNHDVISGRNALTPVLNRDDAMREWERRQTGKAAAAHPTYQPLEYLQQQAELAAAQGYTNWSQHHRTAHRYPAQPSSLSQSYQPTSIVVDDPSERREVVMSSVRAAARGDQQSMYGTSNPANLSSPPQAYVGNSAPSSTRYASSYSQQQQQAQQPQQSQAAAPFDGLDRGRADIATMYVPMQPDQYQSAYGQSSHHASPEQRQANNAAGTQSFYNAGVVASGAAQRNPFVGPTAQNSPPNVTQRDGQQRSANGMDIWPR